jgi:hypothetical protein
MCAEQQTLGAYRQHLVPFSLLPDLIFRRSLSYDLGPKLSEDSSQQRPMAVGWLNTKTTERDYVPLQDRVPLSAMLLVAQAHLDSVFSGVGNPGSLHDMIGALRPTV